MNIRPRFRERLIRAITTTLFLSLFSTFPLSLTIQTASANNTTVTKTITIKGANDALYNGAQVSLLYYATGDSEETIRPIQTTGLNGQVTISYPTNAEYAQIFITPQLSDTTNAVQTVDLLTGTDATITNVKLKASNVRVDIRRPDGVSAGLHTCIDYPKSTTSRWHTIQYRTTRAGAFGIALPTTLNPGRDYQISINPCNQDDYKYLGATHGLRRASNGTITLYTDDKFTTALSASGGIYTLTFTQGLIRGSVEDTNGNPISLSAGTSLQATARPILPNGARDETRNEISAWQTTKDGKFTFGSDALPGIYEVVVDFYGPNAYPPFIGGRFWVNNELKFSVTEAGPYTPSIDLVYTLPSSGLIKFKFVNPAGNIDLTGGSIVVSSKALPKSYIMELRSDITGTAVGQVKSGSYILDASPRNSIGLNETFTLEITSGSSTLRNSLGVEISKVGDYFPIQIREPTFNFRIVSPADTNSSLVGSRLSLQSASDDEAESYGAYVESTTTINRMKATAGIYNLYVHPASPLADLVSSQYSVNIDSVSVSVKSGNTVINPVNGIYTLVAKRALFSGKVLNPAGSEAVRWTEVRAVHSSKRTISSTSNATGAFALDFSLDGTWLVSAYPRSGVNANFGISDSITVMVTNGVPNPSSLDIRLRTANVSGIVSGPNGPSPFNWLEIIDSRTGAYLDQSGEGFSTDEDGGYSLYLPTGAYGIRPSSDYENTGGVATTSRSCVVGANPATPVNCDISLTAPNVSGTVTIGGVKPARSSVGFRGAGKPIWSGWSDVNNYGVNVPTGTYRMWITYQLYSDINNSQAIPGPLCTVPETGTVICDAQMPATNLNIQVADWVGAAIGGEMTANISIREGSQYQQICCAYSDKTLRNGEFKLGLLPGDYKIDLYEEESVINGVRESYLFSVTEAGAISSMRLTESGTVINAVNGLYTLSLKEPIISGRLFGIDGITPEPYLRVRLFNSNGLEISATATDRLGRFSLNLEEILENGTYYLMAEVRRSLTKGNSKLESFTVLNGKATGPVTLKLNTPNVQGTAAGPISASPNSFLQVQSTAGLPIISTIVLSNITDSSGKFSFYLPTGTYTITGETIFSISGGIRSSSQPCVVNAESITVSICNINFRAPNVTGAVTVPGNSAEFTDILFFPAYGIADNPAINNYGWLSISNGRYGLQAAVGTYRTYLLSYKSSPGEKVYSFTPGPLCVVPVSGPATCNIALPTDNFIFKVRSATNSDLSTGSPYTLEVKNGDQYQSVGSSYRSMATSSLALVDGSYRIKIEPGNNSVLDGNAATFTFDVINAAVTNLRRSDSATVLTPISGAYQLQLLTSNLTGTVTGPRGAASDTSIEVSRVLPEGGINYLGIGVVTNAQGKFAFNLPTGIYILKARPDFVATGGGETSVRCTVNSESLTVTICDIALNLPNVSGTISVAGSSPQWGSVLFQPASGIAGNTATDWYGWFNLANGRFGFTGKAGTYRMHLYLSRNSGTQIIPAGLCVVPESGTVICDSTLPVVNFRARVLDAEGIQLSRARVNITTASGDGSCCSFIEESTREASFNIINGRYIVDVTPSNGVGGSQRYNLVIESGTVTSLKAFGSSDELTATAGLYTLRLRPPTFSGTVFKSDGVTVAPAIQIEVRDTSRKWSTTVESDASGKFVIDIPSGLDITQVNITAFPNRNTSRTVTTTDKTIGRSVTIEETISAGIGNQNLSLRLRSATINGRVTGSKGALINRNIQVQQLDGSGNWNWLDFYAYTDRNGDFAEYLSSGTYRLYSAGDTRGAGGGETFGPQCVINADSAIATICNLALLPPNVSGFAKSNLINISSGQILFSPDNGTPRDGPRGSRWSDISQGEFGVTLPPDTYQISIWLPINGKYSQVFGPKCIVPETGTVNCNINLPAVNLAYRVLDANNVLRTSNVFSSLELKSGNTWNGICCSYPDQDLRDGKFESPLIDGEYRLMVRPNSSSVIGTSQSYTFIVESATVKNFAILGSTETMTPVAGIFTTKLRQAAISGTVFKADGLTPYSNARICARPQSQQNRSWRTCAQTNESGKYTIEQSDIVDGIWEVQAFSTRQDLTVGSSLVDSLTVTSGIGSKIANLNLRAPNFLGLVSGPLGASPNNYINIRKYFDNGSYDWIETYFITDSQGRFAFTLEPGRYRALAGDDMSNAGGTAAMSPECIVTLGNTTSCNISLQAPNVTGTVSVVGVPVGASVEFLKETNKGFEQFISTGTSQNGKYALTVPPGNYRARIYLYSSGNYILGPPCVVQVNINLLCDINLPATNLRFKVNKASGTALTGGIYANFTLITENLQTWAGTATSDLAGNFRGTLLDGNYRVDLYPNGDDSSIGTSSSYMVTIDSGTVTSLTRTGSTTQLVATSGVYTLSLGTPSISGIVVAPDGSTPVPNSRVMAFTNPYNRSEVWSDKNATFGFAKLPDGTYSVIAAPGWEDPTKAQSMPQQVTLTGGQGISDLRLVLRTPNVTGVVRGPTSKVSVRNWLDINQKLEGGNWATPDYFTGLMTSPEGNYGLYLAPGTYRIRANGDMDQAGGVGTAVLCIVPSTGTVQCDITLKAPNFKVKIVAPSSTNAQQGAYAWGYIQSAADEDAILNRYISFQWLNGGELQGVLEDGTWRIRTEPGRDPRFSGAEFIVTVDQGVVTKVANQNGETLTAVGGIYLLPLTESNLTGTITFNGSAFTGSASVTVLRQEGEFFGHFTNKWSSNNEFGFTLPAGNYKIEVTPYGGSQSEQVATTRSQLCVVEVSAPKICNVALASPNLRGRVTDKTGAVARFTDAYILLQQDGQERWVRWLGLRDGLFDTHLEDGTYRIQVMPRWDYRRTYTDRSYIIKVESGTVQSVTDFGTSNILTATDNIYSFALGTPSASGKIFNPGSSQGAAYVGIQVAPSASPNFWRYSTQSDANGEFSLNIPDGTYIIQGFPDKTGAQFGKSETQTITITNNLLVGAESVTLTLRNPNFSGRVVIPGTATPLANVNVNINIDGEYSYSWTDSDGRFGTFIDNPAPNCPSNCSVYLNYYKGSEYTPKYHQISTLGNIGDLEIGGVTSTLTILTPQSSGPALPSRNSWVSVEEITNNSRSWVTSGVTSELGRVGLSLTTGRSYLIWAYPNGEQSRSFAPKKLEITNYSPETHSALAITFALPNVTLKVLNSEGRDNIFGWFTVSRWDSATSTATQLSNASLDSKGYAALTLDDGDYQLRFWPGKGAKGVQKFLEIKVMGSTVTSIGGFVIGADSLAGSLVTAKLPSGNISGSVLSATATPVPSALIAAYRFEGDTNFISTSSDANGNFQLNLDLTTSWIVKSVDPVAGYSGSLNIAANVLSNAVLSNQNITLATAP